MWFIFSKMFCWYIIISVELTSLITLFSSAGNLLKKVQAKGVTSILVYDEIRKMGISLREDKIMFGNKKKKR